MSTAMHLRKFTGNIIGTVVSRDAVVVNALEML